MRITITRSYNNNYIKEQDFLVENALSPSMVRELNSSDPIADNERMHAFINFLTVGGHFHHD